MDTTGMFINVYVMEKQTWNLKIFITDFIMRRKMRHIAGITSMYVAHDNRYTPRYWNMLAFLCINKPKNQTENNNVAFSIPTSLTARNF